MQARRECKANIFTNGEQNLNSSVLWFPIKKPGILTENIIQKLVNAYPLSRRFQLGALKILQLMILPKISLYNILSEPAAKQHRAERSPQEEELQDPVKKHTCNCFQDDGW